LGQFHGSNNGNHDYAELLRNRGALDKHAVQRERDLTLFDGNKCERIALGNGGKREAPLSAQPKDRLKRRRIAASKLFLYYRVPSAKMFP